MEIIQSDRQEILDFLLLQEQSFHGNLDLISFLKRVWNLSSMPSTDSRFKNAEGDIWKHMVMNTDWEETYLLNSYLGLLESPNEEFIAFLTQTVHPLVVNEIHQNELVDFYNKVLLNYQYIFKIKENISGKIIYQAIKIDDSPLTTNKLEFEIVLSFAGEDREYVERVAEYLKSKKIKLFYDAYEEVTLWGKDLVEHLDKVYRGSARYCVLFISKFYADKMWPIHERRSAFARALVEKTEYILPARFDDTEIPGLRPTIRYIDLRHKTPDEFGLLIIQKLGEEINA
jgi:hypothetical protein